MLEEAHPFALVMEASEAIHDGRTEFSEMTNRERAGHYIMEADGDVQIALDTNRPMIEAWRDAGMTGDVERLRHIVGHLGNALYLVREEERREAEATVVAASERTREGLPARVAAALRPLLRAAGFEMGGVIAEIEGNTLRLRVRADEITNHEEGGVQ